MHIYFGELYAYDLFNSIGIYVALISSVFLVKAKTEMLGLWSRSAVFSVLKKSEKKANILKHVLSFVEIVLMSVVSIATALFNSPFGELVGTGANYFGNLFGFAILGTFFSVAIMANPMEQMDIVTILLPVRLFFVKIACFCQGCCWGIPWEYGPYNHNPNHPGNQVPVQAIEIFWVMLIFIFLLWYRKRAKKGTVFPMYMILYSATRFPIEFFKADYENILGPFKMYHFLCAAGFVIGLSFYLFAVKFGDRMFKFVDNKHEQLNIKIDMYEKHMRDKKRQIKQQTRKKRR